MDVQCERCKTEYEFDDALVSGRGTTVRCTHCGHQFKVRRPETAAAPGSDRWIVRTAAGQELTFLTLRELQRAILAKQVTRGDMLLVGGALARPLGSIPELEPFFEGRTSSRPPAGPAAPALHRMEVPMGPSIAPGATDSSPAAAFFAPPVSSAPGGSSPAIVDQASSPLPPPTVPVRRGPPEDEGGDGHSVYPPSSEDGYEFPRRRRAGGWVVAFVLLIAVGVVGWVVAKPYVVAATAASDGPRLDERTTTFLAQGERALADGDLETAQQAFDKASALAERDPRVLLDEARVAAARADGPWLKLRLLASEASDDYRTTKAEFDQLVARASKAAQDAASVAPGDSAVARAQIDAARLAGERDKARAEVAQVASIAAQPETVYVLAALDLAEDHPLWPAVVDRLRAAAAVESGSGRARAALVYALAKSGDVATARAELGKLEASSRANPLLPALHAFVERASSAQGDGGAVHAPVASPAAAHRPAAPAAGPETPPANDGSEVLGDQPRALQAATNAIKHGDFARARRIYEGLVAKNPGDSEALAGLGDVARLQSDNAGAIAAYKRALAVNPSYLPAILGVADTEWAAGDHASARTAYKEVMDRFPEGTYPGYVRARAEPGLPAAGDGIKAPASGAGDAPDGI